MTTPVHRPVRIAVIGTGDGASAELESLAEAVGRELGTAGAVLVCGGKGGVMAAAARGASEAGGLTIGVLPDATDATANPWIAIPIPTGIGYARNAIVARAAHAVIAIGGAYGTLSEIAFALNFGTPVIGLRTWQVADHAGSPDTGIEYVDEPHAAVARALARAADRSRAERP